MTIHFGTMNVTNMSDMFLGSQATIGYARTQADADKFNASSNKPAGQNYPQGLSLWMVSYNFILKTSPNG